MVSKRAAPSMAAEILSALHDMVSRRASKAVAHAGASSTYGDESEEEEAVAVTLVVTATSHRALVHELICWGAIRPIDRCPR